MSEFGDYIRKVRENLLKGDNKYSLRQVAFRIGVQPAYLSKVERGDVAPPGEQTIVKLAAELGEDPDFLLALAGKVNSDLQAIIRERPILFAKLLRLLKDTPDEAVEKIVQKLSKTN
jgi:transcriptional regulator with XRE-family HTH domain